MDFLRIKLVVPVLLAFVFLFGILIPHQALAAGSANDITSGTYTGLMQPAPGRTDIKPYQVTMVVSADLNGGVHITKEPNIPSYETYGGIDGDQGPAVYNYGPLVLNGPNGASVTLDPTQRYKIGDPITGTVKTGAGGATASPTVVSTTPQTKAPEAIWCISFGNTALKIVTLGLWSGGESINMIGCAAEVSWVMLKVAAFILTIVAMVFNVSIDYTLNFKDFIERGASGGQGIVELGWTAFRDLVNIFFIFILVYIGIGTIINSGTYNAKNLLVKVLIAAVFLNFSLFFTKALIDVSNVMTLQFYNAITENSKAIATSGGNSDNGAKDTDAGISAGIIKALGLNQIFTLGARTGAGETAQSNSDVTRFMTAGQILIFSLGGSIFILVTAFVLGAAALMFLYRAITLIFLMILSPVAFAGKILPSTEKYISDWWETLWKNLIMAPVYMANMYVVLSIIFKTGNKNSGLEVTQFQEIFQPGANAANMAFTFFVLIGLMVGCLLIADRIGVAGSKSALSAGKKWSRAASNFAADRTLGAAARGVVGGTGYALANSDRFRELTRRIPGGGALLRGADNLNKLKIGSKSYNDSVEQREKKFTRTAELHEKTIRRRGESDDDFKARKKANEIGADSYLGITVDKSGKAIAGKPGYLGAFAERRGITAAQTARAKSRGKGAEGKIEDQMRDIQHMLGERDKLGKEIYKKDQHGNEDRREWGLVQKERTDAERDIGQVKADIATAEADLKNLKTSPTATAQDKIALAAEIGVLRERRKELDAAITLGKNLEEKLKQLSVQKDQIK